MSDNDQTNIDIITTQLAMITMWRNDGRTPSSRLLLDIEGYEWLLAGDAALRKSYFKEKSRARREGGILLTVRDTCRAIGWKG